MLIIPWRGRYMIGTTDIRFDEDPDHARCDIGEVDYLLGEVNSLIPEANLTLDDVLYTFSGVRPLPYVPDKAESSVPRSHVLHDHSDTGLPGLVTVVGGKLTTYRQLAEDAVDDAYRRLGRTAPPCRPASGRSSARSSPTSDSLTAALRRADRPAGGAGQTAGRPVRQPVLRGVAARRTAPGAQKGRRIPAACWPRSWSSRWTSTWPGSLTDVLARRVMIAFEPDHGLESIDDLAGVLAEHLGWDADTVAAQIDEYHAVAGQTCRAGSVRPAVGELRRRRARSRRRRECCR